MYIRQSFHTAISLCIDFSKKKQRLCFGFIETTYVVMTLIFFGVFDESGGVQNLYAD